MKKWLTLTVAAGLLASALTATEAAAVDPAPTIVQIRWKDDSFQFVHVTWDEDAPRPNEILVQGQLGSGVWDRFVPADGPNEVDIPKAVIGTGPGRMQIAVAVGTWDARTSAKTLSPWFDTELAGVTELVSVTQAGTC